MRKALAKGASFPNARQPEKGRMMSVSSSSVLPTFMETRMADVIRLQDRGPKGPRRTFQTDSKHDAVILMFTGIRYERIDGYEPAKTAALPVNGATIKH